MKITDTKTWEQEFDEKWKEWFFPILSGQTTANDIKDFIRQELASQLEELAERVEKIENPFDKCYEDEKYYAFNQALDDVLSSLKGEMK